MKKKYLSIVLLSVMLINFSCKKYLEVKTDARMVIPKSLKDLQGLLDDGSIMNQRTTPSLGESSADDFFWLQTTYDAQPLFNQNIYKWIPVDFTFGNDWNLAYLAIYNTNLSLEILEKIPRTEGNAKEWDNIKGSALFFRSYYFLLLSMQFAKAYDGQTAITDLGIVLKLTSDFNEKSYRASVEECYKQIIGDLNIALSLLPDQALHTMRPSKTATYALLARTYLYKRDYKMALEATDEALKLKNGLMDFNNDEAIAGLTANIPFKKFNKEIIFYTEMETNITLHLTTRARIDSNLYASYDKNDLRKKAFFKAAGDYQQFKGSYASNATTLFSGLAVDELYLTRAECNAFLGNISHAMEDINTLLKSRWDKTVTYIPLTITDRIIALNLIRLERRKELLMRNLRWMDVKRWNKEGEQIVLKRFISNKEFLLQPNTPYYALPIPKDIVDINGFQQN